MWRFESFARSTAETGLVPSLRFNPMILIQIAVIMFLAVLTQALIGFGSVIVAMGLLPAVIGLEHATPLTALVVLLVEPVLVVYYRHGLDLKAVGRLVLGSLAGVPLGIFLLNRVPEAVMLPVLGAFLFAYGLYGLSSLRLPRFTHPGWAYALGLLSGVFGGAYAITGPPVVVYGHGRRWEPAAFKANLQTYFILTSTAIVIGHAVNGSFTAALWPYFWAAMPAALLGLAAGLWLDRFVRPDAFRKLVLGGILLLGIGLVV